MQIWVDGDACPKVVKQILFKATIRTGTKLTIVANSLSQIPVSPFISAVMVSSGFDEADNYIESKVKTGDLVITADIPLANAVVDKGCTALNPRGILYTSANMKNQLATRNLMAQLRDQQIISGGPSSYTNKNAQEFANQLDKILARLNK